MSTEFEHRLSRGRIGCYIRGEVGRAPATLARAAQITGGIRNGAPVNDFQAFIPSGRARSYRADNTRPGGGERAPSRNANNS